MQTAAFRKWLKVSYLQANGKHLAEGTQISRVANCSTIEQIEGDLDAHFERDGMADLLDRLSYSSRDQGQKVPPRHRIIINGDIANGSTTYRSAANLYRKFRVVLCSVPEQFDVDLFENAFKPTERRSLLKSRIGQDRFRSVVMEHWDYRCAVTGSGILLTASHIKPWRKSNDSERLDAFNGLCLSPLYDRAFDGGMITFTFDGRLAISPLLARNEGVRLGLLFPRQLFGLAKKHHPYLDYHHKHIWKHQEDDPLKLLEKCVVSS